ncbi:MOSC domain-containing protein [Tranquillimonas rosea]|uniref:MOSC domain-containing protein n=1 Tax=Tranquillimonas rosea TaxID=641238 RepID=A0A1H9UWQ7_9RHOB|nr:MOSC domain-containing protein [Tranquillimonas rosea]SES13487.1 MOSC domain-containing protein [Tranquillimonas rosea]
MAALKPTDLTAHVTWLGRVPHRDAAEIVGEPLEDITLTFAGLDGEHHAGLTRPSCSRVLALYPKRGTEIRNVRQISIVSEEELALIAADLGLDAIDPAWLGATIVLRGLPDFSHLPPSARLQADSGATLTVDMQNRPCQFPARTIEAAHPGHGKRFKSAAEGRRGVTAWVEREGPVQRGDMLRLFVPDQRAWAAS